jgi:hypothetical protein
LIYNTEQDPSTVSPAELEAVMGAYNRFTEAVRAAGVMVAGEALQPTPTATTVRVRNGQRLTTDGPFAETKEALGGFYLLDCKDLDEAIEWAGKIPGAETGSIEVRPLVEFSMEEQQVGTDRATA